MHGATFAVLDSLSVSLSFASFVMLQLRRNPTRTTLVGVSLSIAFLLLVLLRSIAGVFSVEAGRSDTVIYASSKYPSSVMLKLAQVQQVRSVEGVIDASPVIYLYGFYQEPKLSFSQLGIDPLSYFSISGEAVDQTLIDRLVSTRTGAVISRALANEHGWRVGDKIPIQSTWWLKEDKSYIWEFDIVGVFSFAKEEQEAPPILLFNYEYFQEAAAFAKSSLSAILARVESPNLVETAIETIDSNFANSSAPTNSNTREILSRESYRRIGDIGTITNAIIIAVFFTVLIVSAHAAAQSLRDRRMEFAVMKTFGFTNELIAGIIFAESIAFCLVAAIVGIGAALVLEPVFNEGLKDVTGRFDMSLSSIVTTFGAATATGFCIAIIPVFSIYRTSISDALRSV